MGEPRIDRRRPTGPGVTLLGALGLAVVGAGRAHAAVVGTETLLTESTMVTANQTNLYQFDTPSAGTLYVQLTDVAWPQRLTSLTSTIYSPTAALGSLSAAGEQTLLVTGPLDLSAFVTAQAQGGLDLGLYSLDVTFTPNASPVPLPAAEFLLTGGIGILGVIGWRWRREEIEVA